MADATIRPNPRKGKPRNILTPETKKSLLLDFASGRHIDSLTAEYGVTFSWVYRLGRRAGVHCRARQKYTLRPNAFVDGSREAAYWIGQIMSDGWVIKNQLGFELNEDDVEQIFALQRFLGSNHRVSTINNAHRAFRARPSRRLIIASQVMVNQLSAFGVVPNKSKTARIASLEGDRDFWRGMVDGDGSVGFVKPKGRKRAYARLSLCGSEHIVRQFVSFVATFEPLATSTPRKAVGMHVVSFSGRVAARIINHLYDGAATSLRRKREAAMRVTEMYQNDVQ